MSSNSRGNPSMGDIIRTTVVLGVAVLGIFLIGKFFFTSEPEHPTSGVDYLLAASGVEPMADFDPLVPPSLDDGWRSTVARFDANRWRLVVTTADQDFVSTEQSRASVREILTTSGVELKSGKTAKLAGETWSVGEDGSGHTAYLREADGFVYLVIGSAPKQTIDDYVASFVPFSTLD